MLQTFGSLQGVASRMNQGGELPLNEVMTAIQSLFGVDDFVEKMMPFALNLTTKEQMVWLDQLLPLEMFTAYMEAATFIVGGGQTPALDGAGK
jgi:hypothetical protein